MGCLRYIMYHNYRKAVYCMAFRQATFASAAKFNSVNSCDFLDTFETYRYDKDNDERRRRPHQTFAPSSMRCLRKSWFRLRGVEPDKEYVPDNYLNWTAEVGTACHANLQAALEDMLGTAWINPKEWCSRNNILEDARFIKTEHETLIETVDIPMRFACDGILEYRGNTYLIEIKTCDNEAFNNMIEPRARDIDQIKVYATRLKIHNVFVLYQNRFDGSLKLYEIYVTDDDMSCVMTNIKTVIDCVKTNIPPAALPTGDGWCTPSKCLYYRSCAKWGR